MSYLAELKSLEALGTDPTKPTKPPIVGFVGRVGGGISEITAPSVGANDDHLARSCSWRLTFADGPIDIVAVPAVSREQLHLDNPKLIVCEVSQDCGKCRYSLKPGQADYLYCSSSDRQDQPGPYGEGHPARFLPGDQGAACELFEACQWLLAAAKNRTSMAVKVRFCDELSMIRRASRPD